MGLGGVYRPQGRFIESSEVFKLGYKLKADLPYKDQLMMDALKGIFDKEPFESIKNWLLYLDLDAEAKWNWWNLGVAYMDIHKYNEAIEALEEYIIIDEKWGANGQWLYPYYNLADCYHILGYHKKEEGLNKKILNLSPDDITVFYKQVVCALSQGDTTKAKEYITKYIKTFEELGNPEEVTLYALGNIYNDASNIEKAEYYYRKVLDFFPNSMTIKIALAGLLIENDMNIAEGLELVNQTLELQPDNYNFLYYSALGLYKMAKYEEALEQLERSWKLRPDYYHEHFMLIRDVKQALTRQNN